MENWIFIGLRFWFGSIENIISRWNNEYGFERIHQVHIGWFSSKHREFLWLNVKSYRISESEWLGWDWMGGMECVWVCLWRLGYIGMCILVRWVGIWRARRVWVNWKEAENRNYTIFWYLLHLRHTQYLTNLWSTPINPHDVKS